jgi:hypothetical protein
MSYAFHKVYADLVTPDGAILVVYQTWLRLLTRFYGSAGAEIYAPDGRRRLLHGRTEPALLDPDAPLGPLHLDTAEGPLDLELAAASGPFDPGPPSACPALRWRVLALRTAARARLPSGEVLEGTGYVDWVALTRPTRTLGFHYLRWGRAHLPTRSLAFMALDLAGGARWQVGVEHAVGGDPSANGAGEIALEGGSGLVRIGESEIAIEALREIHRGSAFDPARVPNPFHRAVAWAYGGATGERRWLAQARVGAEEGLALHEHVGFGVRADEVGGVVS